MPANDKPADYRPADYRPADYRPADYRPADYRPAEHELAELEALAVRAAREAGRFIVEERPRGLGVADTKTSVNDVVTVMDQRSEQLLRRRLLGERPDDAVLGEEEGAALGTSGITWVIDPIDGTVNYLYEIPAYCVSVAAVVGAAGTPGAWAPVAGAVCDPLTGQVFHARAGGGAWVTAPPAADAADERLAVNDGQSLLQSLVATGFGYLPDVRRRQGAVLAELLPQIRDIRRAGSAALDLCSVASGQVDGYYEVGLNPWDLAAGWLIAAEAGALVTGLFGQAPSAAAVVAAGPGIHPVLCSRLERLQEASATVGR